MTELYAVAYTFNIVRQVRHMSNRSPSCIHTDTSNLPQMCRMSIHFQQKYSRKPHTRAHPQIKGNVIFITIFIDYGQLRVGRIDKSARLSALHHFACFAYALLSHSSTVTATTMAEASVVTAIARTCGFRLCKCRELL